MSNKQIIGHNSHLYLVDLQWGILNALHYPVNDCHEMVIDSKERLFLLTNETKNNIIIYDKSGKLLGTWGNNYPGGHGLTLWNENGVEYLFISDPIRHQVIKTTLTGKEVLILNYPKETGLYSSAEEYKPTETAIAPNGDIYVTDGYGLNYLIQYNHSGKYIRHWGGKGEDEQQFACMHGVAIDSLNANNPTLLITSRNQNAWKRYSLEGKYLSTIHLPGSFVCRPVIHKRNIYGAVFRSGSNQNQCSGYITILDENYRVVSTPGGSEPVYLNSMLQTQAQATKGIFIHPHDVCVDKDDNIYVPQWNSGRTYPLKLERIK
jgi:hypothetical protein